MAEPKLVEGLSEITSVVAGTGQTCAVERSGRVVCWGEPLPRAEPFPGAVAGLEGAVEIALSRWWLCARLGTGEVVCQPAKEQGGAEAPLRVVF